MVTTLKRPILYILFSFLLLATVSVRAQVGNWEETHRGALYFGIGYDKLWYNSSSVHVSQGVQNNYTLSGFTGTDMGPANDFMSPMHYSFHLGYYFNYSQNTGLELSFSPIRYYMPDNNNVQLSGTYMGQKVTDMIEFERARNFRYYLDNGMGCVGLNIVRRFGLLRKVSHKFALDAMVKGGMGLMTPKVTYEFGSPGNSGGTSVTSLQYNLEGGVKWTSHRHVYVELDYHYQMASLKNLNIAGGNVSQTLNAQAATLCLGYVFSVTRHNPMFSKGWPHRKEINHPKPMYHKEEDY
jgi:opacity protein-like surface antigen